MNQPKDTKDKPLTVSAWTEWESTHTRRRIDRAYAHNPEEHGLPMPAFANIARDALRDNVRNLSHQVANRIPPGPYRARALMRLEEAAWLIGRAFEDVFAGAYCLSCDPTPDPECRHCNGFGIRDAIVKGGDPIARHMPDLPTP